MPVTVEPAIEVILQPSVRNGEGRYGCNDPRKIPWYLGNIYPFMWFSD